MSFSGLLRRQKSSLILCLVQTTFWSDWKKMCVVLSSPVEMCFFRSLAQPVQAGQVCQRGFLSCCWHLGLSLRQINFAETTPCELTGLLEEIGNDWIGNLGFRDWKCCFQSSMNPALGVFMFQRRQVLLIKRSAHREVSLRDEEHITTQSICVAAVWAAWGSLCFPWMFC